jgi:protocadherin Fat 1/2/3
MQRLDELGNVDVASAVAYLRAFRAGTVQTLEQYRFVYEAMVAYYLSNPHASAMASRAAAAGASGVAVATSALADSGTVLDLGMGASGSAQLDALFESQEWDDPDYLIHALQSMS